MIMTSITDVPHVLQYTRGNMMPNNLQDFGKRSRKISQTVWSVFIATILGSVALLYNDSDASRIAQSFLSNGGRLTPIETVSASGIFSAYVVFVSSNAYFARYYDLIWSKFYSTDSDEIVIPLFALFYSAVFLSLILKLPEYWFVGITISFWLMYAYKRRRTSAYTRAFKVDKFDFEGLSAAKRKNLGQQDRIAAAKYNLAVSFTRNFGFFGGLAAVVIIVPVALGWILVKTNYAPLLGSGGYTFVSCETAILCAMFFTMKSMSGIKSLKQRVDQGDFELFEQTLR
jgi:hypothetical protein